MKLSVLAGVVARRSNWIPVREPGSNWLLFKYDPERDLIEVQRRGKKTVIDLRQLKAGDECG